MARSLFIGSSIVLAALAGLIGCSEETGGTSPSTGNTASGSGTGGTTASSSASGGGTGGMATGGAGGTGTGGQGGTGGVVTGTGGTGGQGGSGAGVGGQGGTGGVVTGTGGTGGVTGAGGQGGTGGVPVIEDEDMDGWKVADGDCCDKSGPTCSQPELVNPGAFEYLGNGVDDDCDPSTSDTVPPVDCAMNPLMTPTSSLELANAMDLCQITTESPPLPIKKWGLISTYLLLADGSSNIPPKDVQAGVLVDFGPNVVPKKNATMASISTGTARDEGDPGHVYPQNGPNSGQIGNYNAQSQVGAPPAYLTAHGGQLPSGLCPTCMGPTCNTAFDSINLKLRIRVPTNALSFSYNLKFYSAEFPEYLCQQFNDFFVVLLNNGAMGIPADKNIAFDSTAQKNPLSVNNAFFDVCFPPLGSPPGTCPQGTLELLGNGYGGWDMNLKDGGGTVWLTNDAPVVPGETMEIEFILWDSGDHNVDSLVLLDNFRWKITPSQVGTHE
jgi:hypothetical protein